VASGAAVEQPAPSASAAVTATVLLTDIADSTHLWERHPDEMETVVNQHHDLVASAVTAKSGRVVKSTGDGVLALFADATDAVGSAIEIQRKIPTLHWPAVDVLSVRIGIDTGVCRLGRGDVLGRPPNLAARLQSAGHGAQILVSDATAAACVGRLAGGVGLRDLGSFLMRGFDSPIRVHQAEATGLVDSFPPLRAPSPGLDDLPPDEFDLFGREEIIAELPGLLSNHRLVTLWGPAGVGKTSIAARVARAAHRRFDDGMWFVDLSAAVDEHEVTRSVVAALHAQPASGEKALDTVLRCLRPARAALVLDNCERALDGVRTLLAEILPACRDVHVLATSRETLGTELEVPVAVEPLPTPPDDGNLAPATLRTFPSVQLFVTRLVASRPGFALDDSNAGAVAGLCRRADGLPLALDLAAARASVEGLATEPGIPERLHASLTRTFATLGDDEARLLTRLAVFSGPFSRELARAVAPSPATTDRDLDRLVHSAVVQRDGPNIDRYRLLVPLREFCWNRLGPFAQHAASEAHARALVERAEQHQVELRSPRQAGAVEAISSEFAEYRAAQSFLIANGAPGEAARLVIALFQFCLFQPRPEGQTWATTLANRLTGEEPFAAEILGAAALGAWYAGDMSTALAVGERSLVAAASSGGSTTWARTALLNAHGYAGDLNAAAPHYIALVAEAHDSPDPYWQVSGFAHEAISLAMFGRHGQAMERAERAVDLARELGNPDALHWAFHALGRALATHDAVGACEAYEQAMSAAREVDSRFNAGLDLVEWVDIKRRLDELQLARAGAADLLDLLAVSGNRSQLSQALRQAGLVLASTGQREVAAIALLARRGLPAMPTGVYTDADDAKILEQLSTDIGEAWPRLRVRARALAEPALIDLCRSALADTPAPQ
jgi:class 3 adenylate cyclase